jgi:hypothetical protein
MYDRLSWTRISSVADSYIRICTGTGKHGQSQAYEYIPLMTAVEIFRQRVLRPFGSSMWLEFSKILYVDNFQYSQNIWIRANFGFQYFTKEFNFSYWLPRELGYLSLCSDRLGIVGWTAWVRFPACAKYISFLHSVSASIPMGTGGSPLRVKLYTNIVLYNIIVYSLDKN